MKVSPGMADAGVTQMARLKRGSTGDTAMVVGIYNAMEACRLQEIKKAANEPQKAYQMQTFPTWRYGPDGVGKVFERHVLQAEPSQEETIPKRKYVRRTHAGA